MSDSLIAFQPAIDEPSNIRPWVNASSSISDRSKVTCCHLPLRIGETEVDEFDFLVLDHFQDGFCIGHGFWSSLFERSGN